MSQEYGAPPSNRGMPVWAWFVIIPCGCLLVLIAVLAIGAAITVPVFGRARDSALGTSCLSNLKQQSISFLMYTQDYDETLPLAKTWVDSTYPYNKNYDVYRCPSLKKDSPEVYGYAFNSKLSGILMKKITSPNTTTMIYDSSALSKNASDAVTSLPTPPRHPRGNNIGYADGHAQRSSPTGMSQ